MHCLLEHSHSQAMGKRVEAEQEVGMGIVVVEVVWEWVAAAAAEVVAVLKGRGLMHAARAAGGVCGCRGWCSQLWMCFVFVVVVVLW